jgi:predicted nucleotidyltransferase
VKTFWLDRDFINRQLAKAVESLRTNPDVLKIVLFGSFAEDRAVPGSDVDILIVLRSDSRKLINRIQDYLDTFSDIGIAADVFPYTVSELDNPLAQTALRTGRVLFER